MNRLLPFTDRMEEAVRSGSKRATSRTKRYGAVGDKLVTPKGSILELIEVGKVRLDVVRDHYWRDEGCASPQDFEQVWTAIHPRKGFDPEQEVWLHRFIVLPDGLVESQTYGA